MSKSCCEFSQIFDLQGQDGKKRSAQTIPGRYSRRIGDRHVRAKRTGGARGGGGHRHGDSRIGAMRHGSQLRLGGFEIELEKVLSP